MRTSLEEPGPQLVMTVTGGDPSPAELAAVVAVLLAAQAATPNGQAPAPAPLSRWADRSRSLMGFGRSGPGAWRAASLPT